MSSSASRAPGGFGSAAASSGAEAGGGGGIGGGAAVTSSAPSPPSSSVLPSAAPASLDVAGGVSAFLSAFAALHHHPEPAVKAAANAWLMGFQDAALAWQVADAVLHRPSLDDEVYYNAATILRQKLLHHYQHDLTGQQQRGGAKDGPHHRPLPPSPSAASR